MPKTISVEQGIATQAAHVAHEDRLYLKHTDLISTAVKQLNAKDQTVSRDPKLGGEVMLRLSAGDLNAVKLLFPDLESPDREIRTEAWRRFARSPISRPFHRTRFPGQNRVMLA